MIVQYLDGIEIKLKAPFDLNFINDYGKVFKVFERGGGNLCFGVEKAGKRYFLKFAGAELANADDWVTPANTIERLKKSVPVYKDLKHPLLANIIDALDIGGGFMTVFDWFNGESFGYPQPEMCKRFMALPNKEKNRVFEGIMEFHSHVAECNYVAIDFNDQSPLYDFDSGDFVICDIDSYVKQPCINVSGDMGGDPALMSPEEETAGAVIDEISNVYAMGGMAFIFFAQDDKYSPEKWSLSDELYEVAKKAISESRTERQQSIRNLIEEWRATNKK
jgi:serine/threonine-protein kinase